MYAIVAIAKRIKSRKEIFQFKNQIQTKEKLFAAFCFFHHFYLQTEQSKADLN